MADKLVPFLEGMLKMKDMGDGSYAVVVFQANGSDEGEPQISAIGSPTDAPWDGASESASLISISKACYAMLKQIEANTGL